MNEHLYTTNTYQHGFVEIVVHRPILDDQERKKREEALRRAIACFGKEVIRGRSERNVSNG